MLRLALVPTLCLGALVACRDNPVPSSAGSRAAAASTSKGASGADFASRGGDACAKYLTPDLVAAVLNGPAGEAKKLSPQACSVSLLDHSGAITITLNSAGPQAFDAFQKYLVDPHPLPGVGDRAVQSMIGIASIQGNSRGCNVDAGGAPNSLKLHGQALGEKLGAICNAIYADAK